MIGVQCAYLATHFPVVYWNTACLRVDAGLEDDANTDYKKVAKAIGGMVSKGIQVSPVDINKSGYAFEPDESNNAILYGMKALNGVNGDTVAVILDNRPYSGLDDFLGRVKLNKTVMVSLIKSGAFDSFGNRYDMMRQYLSSICDTKKRLTMQNFNGLVEKGLVPQELDFQRRLFVFNKSLKANRKEGDNFIIDGKYYTFYSKFFDVDSLIPSGEHLVISQKEWKKMYDKGMEPAKEYIKLHHDELLETLNTSIISLEWERYAAGNLSSWEMDSMGYYYHEHELANVQDRYYSIVPFASLSVDGRVEKMYNNIPIYELSRIAGTVIAKNDVRSTVSILTKDSGVIDVKFNRDIYAFYNRRISQVQPDGTKKVQENGWFQKGTLIAVTGHRRNDMFVAKKYKRTPTPLICKIETVKSNGTLVISEKRYDEEGE